MNYHLQSELVASQFTDFLITNGYLQPSGIPRNLLFQRYSEFVVTCPNLISRWEILRCLNFFKYIKKRSLSQPDYVIFNASVFNNTHAQLGDGSYRFRNGTCRKPAGLSKQKRKRVKNRSGNARTSVNHEVGEIAASKHHVYSDHTSVFRSNVARDQGLNENRCEICDTNFEDANIRKNHEESILHQLRATYRSNKKSLLIHSSKLILENGTICTFKLKEKQDFTIKLTNKFDTMITIMRAFDLRQLTNVNLLCYLKEVGVGAEFSLKVEGFFEMVGSEMYPVALSFQQHGKEGYDYLLLELELRCESDDVKDLGPVAPFVRKTAYVEYEELPIIPVGRSLQSSSTLKYKKFLPLYKVPAYMSRILNRKLQLCRNLRSEDEIKIKEIRQELLNSEGKINPNVVSLTSANFSKRWNYLMWIEELQMEKNIHDYDCVDQVLTGRGEGLFSLKVPGLLEGRPSVIPGDKIYVKNKGGAVLFEGLVRFVQQDSVVLEFAEQFFAKNVRSVKVDVEFRIPRYPLQLSYRAIEQAAQFNVNEHLFPNTFGKAQKPRFIKKWYDSNIAGNEQQQQAVLKIVAGSAYPAPYIVFGPPGTGKTVTIVEAIKQLWCLDIGRICVCAPSNSAADVIVKRLLKHVPSSDVLRFYAVSRKDNIPLELQACSKYDLGEKELLKKRIVVSTIVNTGRLVSALEPGQYSYLFIDEAGYALEPELLIPLIGLFVNGPKSNKKALCGHVILCGDPKQLGPIVQSSLAGQLGLEMSLLERLMIQCPIYHKDPSTDAYNPLVITKLIKNYRSNEKLLHIPNKLFYDNQLLPCANPDVINCMNSFDRLPNRGFPLLFHGIHGKEEREANSPSFFNLQEVQCVLNYLDCIVNVRFSGYKVKESDIGIITPYRKQVQKIRKLLSSKRKWNNIDVGSVEEFQGQEKLIIIITTVRSRFEFVAQDYRFGLGFLGNPKRFNVAITRAKALLIVIGNPDILQCDNNWRELLEYCIQNKSIQGHKQSKTLPENFDPFERLSLDLSSLRITNAVNHIDGTPAFRTDF